MIFAAPADGFMLKTYSWEGDMIWCLNCGHTWKSWESILFRLAVLGCVAEATVMADRRTRRSLEWYPAGSSLCHSRAWELARTTRSTYTGHLRGNSKDAVPHDSNE